jgi:polygalacturonase
MISTLRKLETQNPKPETLPAVHNSMGQMQIVGIETTERIDTVRIEQMKNPLAQSSFVLAALVLWQATVISSPSVFAADAGDKSFYNVRNYGAAGDGKNLDSPAIDKAIQAASAAGGGTVYLPPGTYLSGTIHLASNIHLFMDMGATILAAPQDMNAYDEPEHWEGTAYQDGGHTYFRNSLIYGEGLTNVSITGQGMIDGSA